MDIMNLTSAYTILPVMGAGGLGGPVLVAAGGLVVILAIVLVFVMVLRSNGNARKTSSGIGYDAHQGAYGQSRAPVSQPGRPRQGPPWPDDFNGQRGDPASRPNPASAANDWASYGNPSAPAAANAGRGAAPGWGPPSSGDNWGAEQPASSPQWGGAPNGANPPQQWGGAPAAQGPAQPGWGQRLESAATRPTTGVERATSGASGVGTTSRACGGGAPDWGNAPANPAGGRQDWGGPAPASAPAYGGADYGAGGYGEDQRTHVVRPATTQTEPRLVVSEGKEPGRNYEVRKDRITIGRSRDSDIFLEDLAVSRTHTTINRQPNGRYLLRDERSANGTLVNGQQVNEHLLEDGDKIQVGQTVLVFVNR